MSWKENILISDVATCTGIQICLFGLHIWLSEYREFESPASRQEWINSISFSDKTAGSYYLSVLVVLFKML
jgi:hypothetical protein